MNVKKGRVVISHYRSLLSMMPKNDGPFDKEPTHREALCHVRGMLDKMSLFLDAVERSADSSNWDKFNRWLGFCQGVFWLHGDYTLNQMRDHNRT